MGWYLYCYHPPGLPGNDTEGSGQCDFAVELS